MQRDVKQNWNYKTLHTTGQRVVKLDDRLKRHFLDSIEEVDEFIDDHVVLGFDHMDDTSQCLQETNNIVEKYKWYRSELKIALGEGFEGIYKNREALTTKLRNYLRDLSARNRELKKLDRQKAAADLEKANQAAEHENWLWRSKTATMLWRSRRKGSLRS